MKRSNILAAASALLISAAFAGAQTAEIQPYGNDFKVFQFPRNVIPRIDGDFSDWEIVPDSYAVGIDQMWDDSGKHSDIDRKTLDIKVKVGWVEGFSRLYFYYEAYDNYWDFDQLALRNDTFEIVVDGDLSGGPHIAEQRVADKSHSEIDAFFELQNVHAQNYHFMTPPTPGKDWTMVWGQQQWLKELPWANYAYDYKFEHGQDGVLRFEFYVTVFDYCSPDGPLSSRQSEFYPGKNIGLCWAVIDYDGGPGNSGFWNLSKWHKMYGNASMERVFTLMPLEKRFRKSIEADWSFTRIENTRVVAFRDKSYGEITSWRWDFGDGTFSDEKNPVHEYKEDGFHYVVTLYVEGPEGSDRRCKVWDVCVADRQQAE
ncbi:MAG: PKD domain-containing protein [Bacteroidales bacterium]|nr:PKD domain-containing protein [Bacteroidales bacterium]